MSPACVARFSTLRSLEMSGPLPLRDEAVDDALTRTSPGDYALGSMDGGAFIALYVGRSDCDLRDRLHEWVGMRSRYERYASPAKALWGVRLRHTLPVDSPVSAPVGSTEDSYTRFASGHARSAGEAYAKEWRNCDAFAGRYGLDDEVEPISGIHSTRHPTANEAAAAAA